MLVRNTATVLGPLAVLLQGVSSLPQENTKGLDQAVAEKTVALTTQQQIDEKCGKQEYDVKSDKPCTAEITINTQIAKEAGFDWANNSTDREAVAKWRELRDKYGADLKKARHCCNICKATNKDSNGKPFHPEWIAQWWQNFHDNEEYLVKQKQWLSKETEDSPGEEWAYKSKANPVPDNEDAVRALNLPPLDLTRDCSGFSGIVKPTETPTRFSGIAFSLINCMPQDGAKTIKGNVSDNASNKTGETGPTPIKDDVSDTANKTDDAKVGIICIACVVGYIAEKESVSAVRFKEQSNASVAPEITQEKGELVKSELGKVPQSSLASPSSNIPNEINVNILLIKADNEAPDSATETTTGGQAKSGPTGPKAGGHANEPTGDSSPSQTRPSRSAPKSDGKTEDEANLPYCD